MLESALAGLARLGLPAPELLRLPPAAGKNPEAFLWFSMPATIGGT